MSSFSIPAITAFVEATAGIIRLTTPVKTKHTTLSFPRNYTEIRLLARLITEGCTQRYLKLSRNFCNNKGERHVAQVLWLFFFF